MRFFRRLICRWRGHKMHHYVWYETSRDRRRYISCTRCRSTWIETAPKYVLAEHEFKRRKIEVTPVLQ